MSYNKVKIRRGSGVPDTSDISSYELGYDYTNNKLYIHDPTNSSGQEIVEITGSTVSTASVSNGASTLATGDQIYDFVVGQGYLTSVPNHSAALLTSGTLPLARLSNIANSHIASDAQIQGSKIEDVFLKNNANDTTSGTITAAGFTTTGNLSLAGHAVNDIDIGSEFVDADDHLMTSGAIKEKIESYGYVTSSGISHDGSTANGVLTYKDSDEATVESSLIFNGSVLELKATSAGRSIEVGSGATGDITSFVDLIGDTTYSDYGARFIRFGGANATTDFRHRGTGDFRLIAQDSAALSLQTASTERLRITSAGKVGIGNASPTGVLHVSNSDGSNLARFNDTDSSHAGIIIAADTNGGHIGNSGGYAGEGIYFQDSAEVMRFYAAGSERMRLTGTGRLGIGTTSPSEKLEVSGGNSDTYIEIHNNGGYDSGIKMLGGSLDVWKIYLDDADNKLRIDEDGTAYMTIDAGKVGIGIDSPTEELDVNGAGRFRGNSDSSDVLYLGQKTSNAPAAGFTVSYHDPAGGLINAGDHLQIKSERWGSDISFARGGQGGAVPTFRFQNSGSNGYMELYKATNPSSDATYTTQVRLNVNGFSYLNGGNLGIGTSSPNTLLHIKNSGSGTTSTLKLEDNAREMYLGRDAIKVTTLDGSTAAQLYINSNTTFSGNIVTGGNATIGGWLTASSTITTNYGVSFTNGNTNFIFYNNTGDNLFYLRDTTNSQMLQTWTTSSTTIHKNLIAGSGILQISGSSASEGGEIQFSPGTSGSYTTTFHLDSFQNKLRVHSGGVERFSISTDGTLALNGTVSGTAVLDEDNMASNHASKLATQQSIKAYVDANSGSNTASDGSAGTPAFNFTSDTNTGMYRVGSDALGFSVGGNVGMQLTSDHALRIYQSDEFSADYIEFYANDSTAYYHHGHGSAHQFITDYGYIQLGPGNANWGHIQTDRNKFYFNKQITVDSGVVSAYDEDLSLQRQHDNTNDRIVIQDDRVVTYVNGQEKIRAHDSYNYIPQKIYGGDGSAGAPMYNFWNDSNTGMFRYGTDQLGFTTAGTTRMVVKNAGVNFINHTGLQWNDRQIVTFKSNSNDRGVWNPWVSSIRNSGIQRHFDEEFEEGTNSVNLYNNAGGSNLVVSRITASADSLVPPNKSGKVMKIAYNGNGTTSPNYGGIYQTISSEENHTFVQIFQAKLASGRYFVINENAQGTNNTSYWLTDNYGTGKWEWYARVSHCGDSGTFGSGGHISVAGGADAAFNWYIASMTQYDVTESPYNYTSAGKGSSGQLLKADGDGTYSWQSQGGGSNLDADKLDGIHASQFLRSDAVTETITSQNWNDYIDGTEIHFSSVTNHSGSNRPTGAYHYGLGLSYSVASGGKLQLYAPETASAGSATNQGLWYRSGWNTTYRGWAQIWDSTNDGSGSGLDADLLDGVQGSVYLQNSGTWNGANFAGSRHKGFTINGGELSIQRDHPNNQQVSLLVDGGYSAGENNGFWSLYSNNSWNNRVGFGSNTSGHMLLNSTHSTGGYYFQNQGTTRCIITYDGQYHFGAAADRGTITWDTGKAIVKSQSGNTLELRSQNATDMIAIETNQTRFIADGTERFRINGNGIDLSNNTANKIVHNNGGSRDKYRVWTSSAYAIGMDATFTFGGLNSYAMTFQMNTDADRGFWWGDNGHSNAQGAMSLTNDGELTLAHSMRIGYGESDTTTPGATYRLDVSGSIGATADVVAYISSDKRLKDNIKNIANPLEKLEKLNGVEFDWNDKQDLYKGHDIGVIAQEVEEVLPEIVDTREDGHKAVKYDRMVALLIEAVKEQQQQINELKEKLNG